MSSLLVPLNHFRASRKAVSNHWMENCPPWLDSPRASVNNASPVAVTHVPLGALGVVVRGGFLELVALVNRPSSAMRPLGHQPPCGMPCAIAQSNAARSAPVWPPEMSFSMSVFTLSVLDRRRVVRTHAA